MTSTRMRFVFVAVLVCIFAVGMATFLNYFKYKSTVSQTVKARVLVVANAIENSVQASLALGLSFGELNMLGGLMTRQAASDGLIKGIDVFDTTGKQLYSTEAARIGANVVPAWLTAASRDDKAWFVEESEQFVAGIDIKNNFNVTVGFLAVRYSRSYVDDATARVGKQLLLNALPVLAIFVLLAPLALIAAIRGFESDMHSMEMAVGGDPAAKGAAVAFGGADGLNSTLAEAESGIAKVRALLPRKA
jgi:hypothetical protein